MTIHSLFELYSDEEPNQLDAFARIGEITKPKGPVPRPFNNKSRSIIIAINQEQFQPQILALADRPGICSHR